ncbi:hypothetical protein L873DRAFT_1807019 [Choiromyces venosus 120613-1]|uniref:Uncharacterized protein n=1 Tax=Choiromyces venosus 120613-1 TaxID=1336337 RepID=A0A3N4JLL3_9PEZI|nr:hypothetical protein L873DRAFT_1807019 [Choiromyces venosus 120613-1]
MCSVKSFHFLVIFVICLPRLVKVLVFPILIYTQVADMKLDSLPPWVNASNYLFIFKDYLFILFFTLGFPRYIPHKLAVFFQ